VAFSTVEFIATATTGGLVGGLLQQLFQWRRDESREKRVDRRRAEDHERAQELARREHRITDYVAILSAATQLRQDLKWAERSLDIWRSAHREAANDAYFARAGLPVVTENAQKPFAQVERDYRATRKAVLDAYAVASQAVRKAGDALGVSGMLWSGGLDVGSGLLSVPVVGAEGSSRLHTDSPEEFVADVRGQIRDMDTRAETLERTVRAELALD
jgi:hypothetical protein